MSIEKKPEKKKTAIVSKQEVAAIKEQHADELKQIKKKRTEKSKLSYSAIMRLDRMIPVLRNDAKKLGIQQISIQVVPKKDLDYLAEIQHETYNVDKEGKFVVPNVIYFSYDTIENLDDKEMRALAWHEFGHIIYGYFFPESAAKAYTDEEHFLVEETFCDEFAYKKFGDTLLEAQLKVEDWPYTRSLRKKYKSKTGVLQTIYAIRRFKNRYGKSEYWLNLADTLGILDEIKYEPEKNKVIGVRPKRNILKGMYNKKH